MTHRWMLLACLLLGGALVLGCPTDDDDSAGDDDDVTGDDDDTGDDDTDIEPTAYGIKKLLLEEFTNTGCGPCADTNPTIDAFLAAVGVGNVIAVKVHVDWPSPEDPFYLEHPTDCDTRTDYYGIDGVPASVVDGLYDLEWYGGNYYSSIGVYYDTPLLADLAVQVAGDAGSGYTAHVGVYPTDDLVETRSLTLQTVVTQNYLSYPSAPGPNGETEFADTAIDFLPDAGGTAVTVAPGDEPQYLTFDFELGDDFDADVMEVVVFLQDDATLEVLQAGTTEDVPPHSFRLVDTEPDAVVIEPDDTATMTVRIQNAWIFSDAFDLFPEVDLPAGWTAEWTADGEEVTAEDATVELDQAGEVAIQLAISPGGEVGGGTATLTVRPHCEEEPEAAMTFNVLTYGADVLLVDADGGETFETYTTDALDAAGFTYSIWSAERGLEEVDLSRFSVVVWNAGWYFPHFVDEEKAHLADFLDGGGRLFVSGQDIGWDLCDPASSWVDTDFYETNLHAAYQSDDTNLVVDLAGVAGDPIGDGLVFDISGGTGADNQEFPSWIEPSGDDAERFVEYTDGSGAAVRAEHPGGGRVVYLAFGFEAIADDATRDLLLARSLEWLQQ